MKRSTMPQALIVIHHAPAMPSPTSALSHVLPNSNRMFGGDTPLTDKRSLLAESRGRSAAFFGKSSPSQLKRSFGNSAKYED